MARLPQPGGDNGNWGDILNDYLSQSHKPDGLLKDNSVTNDAIAPNAITAGKIATNAVSANAIADGSVTETLLDAAVQAKLNATSDWSTLASKPAVIAAGSTQAAARQAIGVYDSKILNVKDFGAIGDGSTNDSAAFQSAINAASTTGGSLYVPKGTYSADGLIVKPRVKLFGDGMEASIIQPPSGSTNDAVFLLDHGITQYWSMEDISLWGHGNANQHGMHFYARRSGGDAASGLWNAQFTRVQVYNFEKAAIWLEGGGNSSLDPIQFLSFEDCVLWRKAQAQSCVLLASGQVNQVTFRNGMLEAFGSGSAQAAGYDLKLCRQLSTYDTSVDGSTTTTNPGGGAPYYVSSKAPHTWSFVGSTFQQAQLAVFLDNSQSISFDTCHFEGLSNGVHVTSASTARIDRSHFGNTGMTAIGGVSPFSIRVSGASIGIGRGNWFGGTNGNYFATDGGSAVANFTQNQTFNAPVTSQLTRQIAAAAATITTHNFPTVYVPGGATEIATITSYLTPGETLTLWAVTADFTMNGTGNVDLTLVGGSTSKLVVPVGTNVLLQRVDRGSKAFHVIGGSALQRAKVSGSVNGTATALTMWTGTQAQYDALGTYDANTVYMVSA